MATKYRLGDLPTFSMGGPAPRKKKSLKAQYLREKEDFEYSRKLSNLRREKRALQIAGAKQFLENVQRGAGNVKKGAIKVGKLLKKKK